MILRTFYAITHAWRYRNQLRLFMQTPQLQLANITNLSPVQMQHLGIEVLVLDFDGVLAAHGEPEPREEVYLWLQKFMQESPACRIFILSNKPTAVRVEYFQQHFPNIGFIIAKRKKPYPDGMEQIVEAAKVDAAKVLLVDDRLCTGILATCIAGTRALWITKPYINFKARPFAEAGFMFLRWLERILLSY